MSGDVRPFVRATCLTLLLLALAALGHSVVATVGVGVSAADASPPAVSSEAGPPDGGSGGDPAPDATPVDVERAFAAASDGGGPARNWSARRLRAATAGSRNLTVVATQGVSVSTARGELGAVLPNGTVVYYEDRYPVYFDVDPVPDRRFTVEYVTAEHLTGEDCAAFDERVCTRNLVNRVNLSTGREERIYSSLTPRVYSARWHDVDRVNETTVVVADIVDDGVFAVDTRDGSTRWRWSADSRYSRDAGGPPRDWTHVNDVEVLPDDRVMVSVRNMDSVVFLNVTGGDPAVDREWTLGSDDRHRTLYEQHNPDYLPAERGGPAVLVADSENGRVVEYARRAGEWRRSWTWRDARLQWPRDADRLPDGDTLVVDTHGDRVVEVAPDGDVVWAARVEMPYDVERLGTGAESAGGPATKPDAAVDRDRSVVDSLWLAAKDAVPSRVANGLLYVAPSWVRFADLAFAGLFALAGTCWGSVELYWSRYGLLGLTGRCLELAATATRALRRRVTDP